jgi:hypothetical protein
VYLADFDDAEDRNSRDDVLTFVYVVPAEFTIPAGSTF